MEILIIALVVGLLAGGILLYWSVIRVPPLPLEPGERLIKQSRAGIAVDEFSLLLPASALMGSLYLTSHRLVWQRHHLMSRHGNSFHVTPPSAALDTGRHDREIRLADIERVTVPTPQGHGLQAWLASTSNSALEARLRSRRIDVETPGHHFYLMPLGWNLFALQARRTEWAAAILTARNAER